ncbi:hypothetical protein AAIG33_20670 [Phytobacter ursingii]|uniref:hypothetical protein n=1 Tax=Phytobacter ursingii TaxID=1972431 RepID=UPI0031B784CE
MKFEDIPYDVQLIAAKCLAHKLTSYGALSCEAAKAIPAKDHAQQVREAFLELYQEKESVIGTMTFGIKVIPS